MRRALALALAVLFPALGCGYKVHVYGEPAPGQPAATIPAGASVHVRPHPNSRSPDLHDRLRGRVERSLVARGFTLAPAEKADYVLFFDCVSKEGSAGSELWPVMDPGVEETMLSTDGSGNPVLNERDDVMREAGGVRDPGVQPRQAHPNISDRIWVHYVTLQLMEARPARPGGGPLWSGWAQWDKTLVKQAPAPLAEVLVDGAFRRFPVRTQGIEKLVVKDRACS